LARIRPFSSRKQNFVWTNVLSSGWLTWCFLVVGVLLIPDAIHSHCEPGAVPADKRILYPRNVWIGWCLLSGDVVSFIGRYRNGALVGT